TKDMEGILRELIDNQLQVFRKLYLKGRTIRNLILIDDYISAMLYHVGNRERTFTADRFKEVSARLKTMSKSEIASAYGLNEETVPLLLPAISIVSRVIKITKAENIWSPGVSLCDGMAYEYAEKEKLVNYRHDFENDIIACAKVMSKRYQGNEARNELIEKVAVDLFEATRRIHGMGKRDKLLLRIASLLNDCGRYISIEAGAECGYDIIMATEMIGLSHAEREIVANVVRFNKMPFMYYDELVMQTVLDKNSYTKIAKLSALFRLADGICRSYRTKVNDVRFSVKGGELIINVYTVDDINLEQGFFFRKASLFEEVFSIRPILRYKRL
ncbi:MAG: exopolyphosphatase, partial [Lachnospiraceae bacterium]|nr:exopolyphosphatase [Lachnospiraceae bacterium]